MRAYRSPAETRLSAVFSAATTRMQSAGQAAAQSEQPTHFSSPFSCVWSRCRPRKRGYTGRLYSGYCCVIGLRKICLNVTPKPLTLSSGRGLTASPPYVRRVDPSFQTDARAKPVRPEVGIARDASSEGHHTGRGHERVDRREGQQHLPAEVHQLVVAQA